jgi:protein-tyrosine phosphatase
MDEVRADLKPAPGTLIKLEGTFNVRDMGGYKTADGKHVVFGKFFRSGQLNKLGPDGVKFFEECGLETVVDFRDDKEAADGPDVEIPTVKNWVRLPIGSASVNSLPESNAGTDLSWVLVEANHHFAADFQAEYRKFFACVQNPAMTPLLFHCTAGKDRAGFAAVLLLSALGVSREDALADYLLSGEYVKSFIQPFAESYPQLRPMFETRPEYLNAAFEVIDGQYGGMENFLSERLGVDLEKMKRMYTE